jgi:hypothetical protein
VASGHSGRDRLGHGVFQFILPSTSFWLGPWAILLMAGVGSAVGVTFRLVRRSITAVDPSAHWRIHIPVLK